MFMIIDFGVLGNGCCALHDSNGFIIISTPASVSISKKIKPLASLLMTNFQFGPLTPHLGKILDCLKIYFRAFFQNLACTGQIWFGLSHRSALLVEFGKIDV
jgi:hypothetical protein